MKTTKGRTQKVLKPMIQKDVQEFAIELGKKYPELVEYCSIVMQKWAGNELAWALEEIADKGRPLTNKERWQ